MQTQVLLDENFLVPKYFYCECKNHKSHSKISEISSFLVVECTECRNHFTISFVLNKRLESFNRNLPVLLSMQIQLRITQINHQFKKEITGFL